MPPGLPNGAPTKSTANKRKDPPVSNWSSQKSSGKPGPTKRVKMRRDARSIATQTSDAALSGGELDLQAFLKAREFEIKALENGMQNSKNSLTTRAFQQVPRDMRRRTASHNVKRVPKRLQKRATREMRDDNTPTVTPNKRKPGSSRGRLRAETAKKLGLLAAKKARQSTANDEGKSTITARAARPKIRTNQLNDPPKAQSKFRKRQIHKTWLPTHMWHAKRARMTEPKTPLWRFSVPITSTEKSYRPTHRAGGARGAIAWDTSYMSTIRLEGTIQGLEKVFRSMGLCQPELWEEKGQKWRSGKRSWVGWLSKDVNGQKIIIAPATVIWAWPGLSIANSPVGDVKGETSMLQAFVRIHPSAFLESWTELLRLSKQQRPSVSVEDLRFEIGSIEITGPGSTETLLGILHPQNSQAVEVTHGSIFESLAGVTNPASLPANAILTFSIIDPRLHYPSRTIKIPNPSDEASNFALLQTLSTWPSDSLDSSKNLFSRDCRFKASRLPSQKAINRRKAVAPPGKHPSQIKSDPEIPIMLCTSRLTSSSTQGSWTLLAPWKCILPIWHGLVHYPLSTGSNPRFGGLDELRQIHFEHGVPWYPADFPGTCAGFAWEMEERVNRKTHWDKRPRGKRVEWASLDLGAGRKGEIGAGWSCDFEKLLGIKGSLHESLSGSTKDTPATTQEPSQTSKATSAPLTQPPIQHCPSKEFKHILSSRDGRLPANNAVATVRLNVLTRGVATPCARIYRIPSSSQTSQTTDSTLNSMLPGDLREQWLSLLPSPSSNKTNPISKKNAKLNVSRIPLNTPLPQRVRLLARSLIEAPPLPYPKSEAESEHPLVPNEEDCIGFVTTGQYSLTEGKGCAIGNILVRKVVEGIRSQNGKEKEGRLCIVRNAGEAIGRLARWEVV
ncbi:POPLD domain-containing protein [Phlyctema vagabunda]|uniref:POPLD domain-containing protein n=1 Tax=Phlyctema vagabunda TaxID=108571 RepID=A0ABR4P675_9HELO